MTNQVCCVNKYGVFNGKCKKYKTNGCWQGYCTQYYDKKGQKKIANWYSRRCGTGYDTISYRGPGGNSNANGFASVLFTQKVPGWLWVNNSLKRNNSKCCPPRIKGHKKANCYKGNFNVTPVESTTSKSTIPVMNSFEDVLAVRKTMAFYSPKNFKKSRKFKRSCNCYM